MIKILDPAVYLYSASEWEQRDFIPRLEDFTEFLIKIEEFEDLIDRGDRLVRFQSNPESIDNIYLENPFVNSPSIPNYYQMQFSAAILPRLLRRLDVCGEAACDLKNEVDELPLPAANAIAEQFVAGLAPCALCHNGPHRSLYFHPGKCSVVDERGFFSTRARVDTNEYLRDLDLAGLFPLNGGHALKSRQLVAVTNGLFELKKLTELAWRRQRLGSIKFHDDFWPSIERADYGENPKHYHARILSSILQAACGYDENIVDHRMETRVVRYENQNHGVWNAYVFRSGPSDRDRRCSRLYYAKIDGGVLLHRYEPDAH